MNVNEWLVLRRLEEGLAKSERDINIERYNGGETHSRYLEQYFRTHAEETVYYPESKDHRHAVDESMNNSQ